MSERSSADPVALILAGGGARGAYEAGALAVLLPVLRLTAGDADVHHAELLSFLLFAPEFARALVALGQEDARRWLAAPHDLDDLWQVGPPPQSSPRQIDSAG
jgi:hypothetical protein